MISKKIREISITKLIIEIICGCIILAAVAVTIRMNIIGRSLWYDESALAYSFVTRSFSELTATGLDLVQSAPVAWLYAVKVLCKIFGYSDYVLRIPSLLAYIGTLILMYYTSKRILKLYLPLIPVAFTASMPLMMQYSNMFKPYMSDAFFALLIICLFYWYKENKLNVYIMAVIWGIILWFSSTACFVEGGVIIASFVISLLSRDKTVIKKSIFDLLKIGIIILVFFAVYYIYWLRKVDDGMHGFWQDWSFPLIPTSLQDLSDMKRMLGTLFEPFYYFMAVMFILCIAGIITAFIKKNVYILSVYGIFLITAFASFVGMYPVNKRLWLFMYPLVIYVAFYVLDLILQRPKHEDNVRNKEPIINIIVSICLVAMCLCNGGIRYYIHRDNVYWPSYEVKEEMEYLESVVEQEDGVYVLYAARPIFLFYNNYDPDKLTSSGNSILVGDSLFAPDFEGNDIDHSKDYEYIMSKDKCYIVTSNSWDEEEYYGELFRSLEEAGTVEVIYNQYETPLFLFIKNK